MMYKAFPQMNRNESYILVIEDSPIDFEVISRTFKRIDFSPQILHWDNGAAAIEFLLDLADKHQTNKMPSMVLLDLNMPGTDGREILTSIKNDAVLKSIPVIILSTSQNQGDIDFCNLHGAEKFLTKPVSLDEFMDVAKTIKGFWELLPTIGPS